MGWRTKLFGTRETGTPAEHFQNPFDGKTYAGKTHVAQVDSTATPPVSAALDAPERKVKMGTVRFLTLDNELAARTSMEDMATFAIEAHRLAEEHLGKSAQCFTVLVQFTCRSSAHDIQLAHQGDASQELLNDYYHALKAAKTLPVREGEVSFQIEMSVDPLQTLPNPPLQPTGSAGS